MVEIFNNFFSRQGCGYGCQLHHAVYCLIVAYGTERTLILKSRGWRYSRPGWEKVFLPLSETCTTAEGATKSHWPGIPIHILDYFIYRRPIIEIFIANYLKLRKVTHSLLRNI